MAEIVDYYFKKIASSVYIEVNKFQDGDLIQTYRVNVSQRTCSCPSRERPTCKHHRMVKQWLALEDHVTLYLDGAANMFKTNPLLI